MKINFFSFCFLGVLSLSSYAIRVIWVYQSHLDHIFPAVEKKKKTSVSQIARRCVVSRKCLCNARCVTPGIRLFPKEVNLITCV